MAGRDYVATAGTLTFAASQLSQTVTIPLVPNAVVDGVLTVNLTLNTPTGGASLGSPATAVLNIVDDDLGGLFRFGAASYSVAEGGLATITVLRTGGAAGDVTVSFTTADATATAGTDYTATSGVLTFTPGVTARTFAVPIRNDGVVEPDRTIMLTLSAPAGGAGLGPQSTAQIVVLDDDAPGTLQFSGAGYRVAEGGLATITVTRTGGSGGTVGVNYTVTAGTATSGVDYLATSGVLAFGPGVTRQTFSVLTLDNLVVDGDRTITLTLDQPTGGTTIGTPSVAVLTIGDNDRGGTVQFSTAVSTVTEGGAATIAVLRAGGAAGGVTVHYATSGAGTAVPGVDFAPVSGTLSFAAGQLSRTFTVSTFADRVAQGDRTVGLQLTTPGGGATLGTQATAMLTIADDEPKLRFSAGAYRIDEGGTATITV